MNISRFLLESSQKFRSVGIRCIRLRQIGRNRSKRDTPHDHCYQLLTPVLTSNGVSFIHKEEDGKRTPTTEISQLFIPKVSLRNHPFH